MQEKYGRLSDMATEAAPKLLPAVRDQFEQNCKLVDTAHEAFGFLENKIDSVLYNGPVPEGSGEEDDVAPDVKFAEELLIQKHKIMNLIRRIENVTRRVEI